MKRVLIFGVGGFVGHYLAEEFYNAGYKVYGSDKVKTPSVQDYVSFNVAELMNSDSISALVNKISPDMIINLAAISSVGASWGIPQETMMVNVVGALNIIEAAKNCSNSPRVMFIGSSEEYKNTNVPMSEITELDASNPYGISKVTQERFAKLYREQYGLKIYCVRPFNHTGVGQRDSFVLPSWCKQVAEIEKSGKPGTIKVGNIKVKRDFSHVKDIVHAYRMIIESDNCERIYNVGSGNAYSLEEMLKYVVGLSNQKIDVEVDVSRIRPIDQAVICCDHSLITKDLGWEPEFTVFEALKEMYEDFLSK